MKYKIFISGVQKELKEERQALRKYIIGDSLLSQFFEVFLFEDLPANDRRTDEVYLENVKDSNIYLGLFGNEYGFEDLRGISPTHKEYSLATKTGKHRLIFIKGNDDSVRHKKMQKLIRQAGEELIRRRFGSQPELISSVYSSLVHYLMETGSILSGPFDSVICEKAGLSDISKQVISWFLSEARSSRDYALSARAPVKDVLLHLDLIEKGKPNNAAILLFGKKPQKFIISSEVKCMHFHGKEKLKPIPSYQIYRGTVFDLVDQAVDFVMSKLDRAVGTRKNGPQASVEYDIPREVVSEGIVNAVAHRDYRSRASVEIMLFSDRLEIWNPGTLPPSLTIKSLSKSHPSQPGNPLIADPLFLTKYIEKAGTGTVDIFENCEKAGLKPPKFRLEAGFFILTVWRKSITGKPELQPESSTSSVLEQYQSMYARILALLKEKPLPVSLLSKQLGQKKVSGQLKIVLKQLMSDSFIEFTIPEKPNSRLQKYRITKKGSEFLKKYGEDV